MKRWKFEVSIKIQCDSREQYLEALTALRSQGRHIECEADVIAKSKGKNGGDIRDLFGDPK